MTVARAICTRYRKPKGLVAPPVRCRSAVRSATSRAMTAGQQAVVGPAASTHGRGQRQVRDRADPDHGPQEHQGQPEAEADVGDQDGRGLADHLGPAELDEPGRVDRAGLGDDHGAARHA
jgi:hypothetical protein